MFAFFYNYFYFLNFGFEDFEGPVNPFSKLLLCREMIWNEI